MQDVELKTEYEECNVEEILKEKIQLGKKYFLIKWEVRLELK